MRVIEPISANRINVFYLIFLLSGFTAHSQIVETTIAPENTRDYSAFQILLSTDNEVYISVGSGNHRPTPAGTPSNCDGNRQHNIYKVSANGQLVAQQEFSPQLLFLDGLHIGGSEYAQMAMTECQTSSTAPNGVGHFYQGQTLVLGVVDTVGATDSSLNFIAGIQDPDCDLHLSRYLGTAYKDGNIYGVYQRSNNTDKCKYIWNVNPVTENTEKTPTQNDFWHLQRTEDQSGFYALFINPVNQYKFQLGELKLDGSSNLLSSELSFEVEEDFPMFLYKNSMLFTAASNHVSYTDVRRYDLDGNIIGSLSTGYKTHRMFMTSFGLLVIQEPLESSNGVDSKRIKLRLLDLNVNEIDLQEFGFENVKVLDYHFDEVSETLTMVGRVGHSAEPDLNQENKKIYFFRAKISDIFPNATAIESLESGRIYPNPSNDSAVFLELKNSDELESDAELVLRFFDVQGKSVNPSYSKAGPALYEINSSELPAGTYLGVVETADGERVFSQLFVVDR